MTFISIVIKELKSLSMSFLKAMIYKKDGPIFLNKDFVSLKLDLDPALIFSILVKISYNLNKCPQKLDYKNYTLLALKNTL